MLTEQVIAIIAETRHIPRETISLDSTFEELEIDSLDAVEIVNALEDTFNIAIPDEVLRRVQSVREVVEQLEQRLESGVATPDGTE